MARILIIQAHPDPTDSLCAALADAYAEGARAHSEVDIMHLAKLDFDPILHHGYNEIQELEPDLLDAQRRIEQAAHVVWVFPMWWVSTPALLKGFLDRTFLPGWAFRYTSEGGFPEKLLRGRTARVIVTMDSPSWWYTLGCRRALKTSFESGTLKFSGFSSISRTMLYGIHTSTDEKRARMLERTRADGERDARKLPHQNQSARDSLSSERSEFSARGHSEFSVQERSEFSVQGRSE